MFKMYSKSCEHALWALAHLPADSADQKFRAADICAQAGLPEPITRKALQTLVHAGVLKAVTGPGGGYRLALDPKGVSILDVIKSVDGDDTFEHCIMGLSTCGCENPCPVHDTWAGVKDKLISKLANQTVKDLWKTAGASLKKTA